jgi:hypothetical protein
MEEGLKQYKGDAHCVFSFFGFFHDAVNSYTIRRRIVGRWMEDVLKEFGTKWSLHNQGSTGCPKKNCGVSVILIYSLLNHRVSTSRKFSTKSVQVLVTWIVERWKHRTAKNWDCMNAGVIQSWRLRRGHSPHRWYWKPRQLQVLGQWEPTCPNGQPHGQLVAAWRRIELLVPDPDTRAPRRVQFTWIC